MSFLRNAGYNFFGALLPAVTLFVTIPIIVHRLGADAYGALVLITSIVGYFGIIDVNATAGSVKYVAEYRATGQDERANEVVTFGLLLYTLIGVAGALVLGFGAEMLVHSVFKVPASWRSEAVLALHISAAAFLVSQLQLYLQSIPQALQRYDISGKLDALFGTLIPLVTIAAVLASGGLVAIVAARLAVSLVHCTCLVLLLKRLLPSYRPLWPSRSTMGRVSSFSAFAYLQRIAAVTYLNADKLLIGAQQSMLALATYVIPYTLVSRVFGMLFRLTQSVFPMASALAASGQLVELQRKYVYAKRYTVYLNACICLFLAIYAQELLHYWMGDKLGTMAPLILIIVAYGLFLESLTNIPSLVNDGFGKPHITGTTALLRSALSLAGAWWALTHYGIVALALTQLLVSGIMSIGFLVLVHRWSMPWALSSVAARVYGPGVGTLLLGSIAAVIRSNSVPMSGLMFVCSALILITLLGLLGWFVVLSVEHRRRLVDVIRSKLRFAHLNI